MFTNLKKSIPNTITLSNLFLGFVSIVLLAISLNSHNQYIETACYLILIAAVLDSIDGKVARKLNISSDFGKEIDSLADLISFCLVPSFLLFVWYNELQIESFSFITLVVLSSFPVMLGAIRLARYNAIRNMRESVKYIGMPTPANAIFICSLILFSIKFLERELIYPVDVFLFRGMYLLLKNVLYNEFVILGLSIFSSLLLMSKVDYNKFPLISFRINRKNTLDLINLMIFSLILISSVWYGYYDIVLLFFILVYIFGNLAKYLFNTLLIKGEK